jgi:tetratricopeptide (TPR) repeat protein
MKRIFFPFLAVIVSLAAGYYIICIWRGISLYPINLSKENLLRAAQLTPSNPDPFFKLSFFYQWDIRNINLEESVHYLGKAIERNPLEQEYWLNLARIYKRLGDHSASEKALENAIRVFPTAYQGRWVSGNLFLQEGSMEKALPHFSYILLHYPNQGHLVYDVLGRAINDFDFVLERVVPKDPSSFKQYLSFLYEMGDKESVQKAWKRKEAFGYKPDRDKTLQHIEFLIAHKEISEAFQVWKARLHEEGLPVPYDSNLITNGDFEKEQILGGGFDWKIEKVSGAEVSFDPSTTLEGKRSLKIVFNGKENVDFAHVYQFVSLKPNTEYVLKANMKTQAITTKSGLKIEMSGVGPAFYKASEPLIGDNGWKELIVSFRTPAQSQGGLVRIRRERTDKFDRFISGSVWIDNVSLIEKTR